MEAAILEDSASMGVAKAVLVAGKPHPGEPGETATVPLEDGSGTPGNGTAMAPPKGGSGISRPKMSLQHEES